MTEETIYVIQAGQCKRFFQRARSTVYKAYSENVAFKLIKFILMELEVAGSLQGMVFIWPG